MLRKGQHYLLLIIQTFICIVLFQSTTYSQVSINLPDTTIVYYQPSKSSPIIPTSDFDFERPFTLMDVVNNEETDYLMLTQKFSRNGWFFIKRNTQNEVAIKKLESSQQKGKVLLIVHMNTDSLDNQNRAHMVKGFRRKGEFQIKQKGEDIRPFFKNDDTDFYWIEPDKFKFIAKYLSPRYFNYGGRLRLKKKFNVTTNCHVLNVELHANYRGLVRSNYQNLLTINEYATQMMSADRPCRILFANSMSGTEFKYDSRFYAWQGECEGSFANGYGFFEVGGESSSDEYQILGYAKNGNPDSLQKFYSQFHMEIKTIGNDQPTSTYAREIIIVNSPVNYSTRINPEQSVSLLDTSIFKSLDPNLKVSGKIKRDNWYVSNPPSNEAFKTALVQDTPDERLDYTFWYVPDNLAKRAFYIERVDYRESLFGKRKAKFYHVVECTSGKLITLGLFAGKGWKVDYQSDSYFSDRKDAIVSGCKCNE